MVNNVNRRTELGLQASALLISMHFGDEETVLQGSTAKVFSATLCVISCIYIFMYHSDHDILHSHLNGISQCVISGFRREVAENCALLVYYAISSGNFLPTIRDNLSVSSSGF